MNYFILNYANKWQQILNYNYLSNKKEVKLYDYCEKTNSMIWIGTGIY